MLATIIEQKKCIKCEQFFDLNNFYKARNKYYQSQCKQCFLSKRVTNYTSRTAHFPILQWSMNVLRHSKLRAKQRNLDHNLTQEWILDNLSEKCPVLGIKFTFDTNRYSRPSLDRFDNNKGYTTDNVRVISYRANMLKSNATVEELEAIVKYMKNQILNN